MLDGTGTRHALGVARDKSDADGPPAQLVDANRSLLPWSQSRAHEASGPLTSDTKMLESFDTKTDRPVGFTRWRSVSCVSIGTMPELEAQQPLFADAFCRELVSLLLVFFLRSSGARTNSAG
jgi:hypothetical protein